MSAEIRNKYKLTPMIDVAMEVLRDLLALPASSWPTFDEARRELNDRAAELLADHRTLAAELGASPDLYPKSER